MPKQHRRDERLSRKQMLSQVSEVTLKRFAKKKACEDCTVCFKSAQKAVDKKAVGLVSTYAHGKGEEIRQRGEFSSPHSKRSSAVWSLGTPRSAGRAASTLQPSKFTPHLTLGSAQGCSVHTRA